MLDLSPDQVLTTTRAVRKRLDLNRKVPRELIEECLDIALQAPNGSNMNTWKWLFVDDPATRAEISRLYNEGMDHQISMLGDQVGDNYMNKDIPRADRIAPSVNHLRQNFHRVPLILIPLMADRVEGEHSFTMASHYGSILPAVWNFMLALRVRGLGSAWTTIHLWREREMAELLKIPYEKYTQVGLFPIAYTIGNEFKQAWRKPTAEVCCWNRFAR